MSAGGPGRLGLRDGLVMLEDQLRLPDVERVVFARVVPKRLVDQTWTLVSGTLWRAPWIFAIHGVACDAVAVYTKTYPRGLEIVRAETQAWCASTPLSFFYDLDSLVPSNLARWDDPAAGVPGDTGMWDGYPYLYVNLGGADPATELVCVGVEVLVSSRSAIQPTFGPDLLFGIGDFESMNGITPGSTADTTISLGSGPRGTAALEFEVAADSGYGSALLNTCSGEIGAVYRVSGYYQNEPGVRARIQIGDEATGYCFTAGGRDLIVAADFLNLADSRGAWRHFTFDLLGRGSFLVIPGAVGVSSLGGVPRSARFAHVRATRVWGMRRWHGRLIGDITVEGGATGPWYGGKSIGVSNLTLNNEDGAYDLAFDRLTWAGATVEIDLAGRYGQRGSTLAEDKARGSVEIEATATTEDRAPRSPLSDARRISAGLVEEPVWGSATIGLKVEEYRTLIYNRRGAPNVFPSDLTANMDPRVPGRPRKVILGSATGIEPDRVDKTTEDCPILEVADPTVWAEGLFEVDKLYLYADTDAASRRDATRRLDLLSISGVITKDLAACKLTCETAIAPFLLDTEHEYFSFLWNGTQYDARVLAGTESFEVLASEGDANADGGTVSGAPTQWQALLNSGNGVVRDSSASAANSYVSTRWSTLPNSTSIAYVEVHAIVWRLDSWNEGTTDYALLYLKDVNTGDRYGSEGGVNSTGAPTTGTFWRNPYIEPFEIVFRWDTDPRDNSAWTVSKVQDFSPGVRYRKGNAPGYLVHDRIWGIARCFLETPPSASNPGLCIPITLAERLQAEMRRLAATDQIDVTYSDATGKITVANNDAGQALVLLTSTGKQKSGWGWLGADTSVDADAGAGGGVISYELANPIYTVADIDRAILRADVRGYKDDAAGTFTGIPGSLIQYGPDALHFLLVKFFKFPGDLVDVPSFVAARALRQVPLAMVLDDAKEVSDVVNAIERASRSDVIFAPAMGPGPSAFKAQFLPWTGILSGYEPHVRNAHWVAMSKRDRRSEAKAKVEVTWGRTLALNGKRSATSDLTKILRGTEAIEPVETDLRDEADAQGLADDLLSKLEGPLVIEGTCRSALLLTYPSQAILVSHERGRLEGVPFRLQSVKHHCGTGLTELVAVKFEEAP